MSSPLKALKKLRKKASKHASKDKSGDLALQQLFHPIILPAQHFQPAKPGSSDSILRELSQDVVGSMLGEVSKPLRPLLDWFNYTGTVGTIIDNLQTKPRRNLKLQSFSGNMRIETKTIQTPAILRLPLKSPPCKGCPAKMGAVCQCAAKRFG